MTQDRIIDLIYDAAVDDGATRPLAAAIADHMRSDNIVMLIGMQADAPPAAACIHGFDDDIMDAYQREYFRYDPWRGVVHQTPMDQAFSLERWVSTDHYQQSRVYQDLTRGRADILYCLGMKFGNGPTISTFAVLRGRHARSYDAADELRVAPYLPHLRRLSVAIERKATIVPYDLDTLVAHPDPVIICDQHTHPVHCSADGTALLDSRTVLALSSSGRLRSIDPRLAIEMSIREAAMRGLPSVHRVDPPCGTHIISIDPCRTLPNHAAITVRNRRTHAVRKAEAAARRFCLTGAETILLVSLATGLTLEEHGVARDVAMTTTRSQLRSIFAKTNTDRQSQLLLAVMETPTR